MGLGKQKDSLIPQAGVCRTNIRKIRCYSADLWSMILFFKDTKLLEKMRFYLFLFLQIFTLPFLTCVNKENKPVPGGSLNIIWTGGLIGLDPSKDWGCAGAIKIIRLIFSPIYIPEYPELCIAQKVTHSQNYKEWEFVLRRNCFFHSDPCIKDSMRCVNAYDVKFTYELAEMRWSNLEPIDNIEEVIVLDSFSVKFVLKNGDDNFIHKLNKLYLYVIPVEAMKKYGDNFSFHPVGSGPFYLESWNEKGLILRKNPRFWGCDRWGQRLPYFDCINLVFMSDVNQGVAKILQGDIDLSPIPADVAEKFFEWAENSVRIRPEYANKFQIVNCCYPSLTILLLNSKSDAIFGNPDFRKGLNYGINREELKKILYLPNVIFASGPTLRNVSGLKYEYNLKKAKALIKKSGFYDRKNVKYVFQYYPNPFSKALAEEIQKQLTQLGIRTELACASRVAVLRGEPRWDLGIVSVVYSDSLPTAQLDIYSQCSAPWIPFKTQVFDSLWQKLQSQKEPNKDLLARLDSLVFENPPFIYLYWSYPVYLAKNNIHNIDPLLLLSPYTWRRNE